MAEYTIQAGDTLGKIAAAHNTSVERLARLNNISNPNLIITGHKLIFEEQTAVGDTVQADAQEKLEDELAKTQQQLAKMQATMNTGNENKGLSELEVMGYGLTGAAAWNIAGKATPHVTNFVSKTTKAACRKYQSIKKSAIKKGKTLKQANSRATRLLDGKSVRVKGNSIKLGKATKVLGKAAVPLAVVTSAVEVTNAYNKGGTKAAVKQGAKCAAGIAGGWAGAKAGAAIGTLICPGIGTAIGGFIGGIGGYFAGEALAGTVV